MRKRDKRKERQEILSAFTMIIQIGLAMLTCMAISFGIGYYIDALFGTKFWVIIFLIIGILASMRSLLVLSGKFQTSDMRVENPLTDEFDGASKTNASEIQKNSSMERKDEGSKKDTP